MVGAPRSGTSLLAGLLVDAGLDPGRDLIPPSEHNPTGFFESLSVNAANDELLAPVAGPRAVAGSLVPPRRHLWLAALDGPVREPVPPALSSRMRAAVGRRPFVLKDPRLSYTLPQWEALLAPVEVVCVLRDPGEVVASIRAMVAREPDDFAGFDPTAEHLLAMWEAMYRSVEALAADRPVTWLHFDDLVHGDGADRLGAALGIDVPGARRTPGLHRSRAVEVPAALRRRHEVLRTRCA